MPAVASPGKVTKKLPVLARHSVPYKQEVPRSTNLDSKFRPKLGTVEKVCADWVETRAHAQYGFSGVTPLLDANLIYTSAEGYQRDGPATNAATYDDRFTTEPNDGVRRGIFLWTGNLTKYKAGHYNALIEGDESVHLFERGIRKKTYRSLGGLKKLSSTMVGQGDSQVPQIKFEMVDAANHLNEEPFA